MAPKYEIKVEQRDIDVNSVIAMAMYDNAFVFSIDCIQKYVEYDMSMGDEDGLSVFHVYLSIGENTLKVDSNEGRSTMVEVSVEGKWHASLEHGKYGPNLYLIRKKERDENWPGWYRSESKEG